MCFAPYGQEEEEEPQTVLLMILGRSFTLGPMGRKGNAPYTYICVTLNRIAKHASRYGRVRRPSSWRRITGGAPYTVTSMTDWLNIHLTHPSLRQCELQQNSKYIVTITTEPIREPIIMTPQQFRVNTTVEVLLFTPSSRVKNVGLNAHAQITLRHIHTRGTPQQQAVVYNTST